MSEASRTATREPLDTRAAASARETRAHGGAELGNLATMHAMRSGAAGTAFGGPPLGNQDQQRQQPVRCTSCEAKARRFGVQAKCAACETRAQPRCTECGDKSLTGVKPALAGASQPLPHLARIQAAFGRHDISGVRTLTGGAAREANDQIGAHAFTAGHRIAFREAPDERLAAHESAHVIQQREGTKAPGGHGGDPWERHADEVADAVVSGRSAEPLLDKVAGGDGKRTPSLQLQQAGDDKKDDKPATVWGFTYRGVFLTDSPAQTRKALEDWAATQDNPHDALRELARDLSKVEGVHSDVDSVGNAIETGRYCRPPDTATAAAETDPNKRIPKVVNEVVLQIINDDSEYLASFHARAIEITNGLLDEGKTRVLEELKHYGVRDPNVELSGLSVQVTGTIDDNKTTRGIGVAAEGMLARKKKLDEAEAKYRQKHEQVAYYVDPRPIRYDDFGHPVYAPGNDRPLPSYAAAAIAQGTPGYEDAHKAYLEAVRDYDVYKQQIQQMYPILASWTDTLDEGTLRKLTKLKEGKDSDAATILTTELFMKLVNIDKVREGIKPGGDVNIWRVPKIVAGTRAQMTVPKGSLKEKVLNDKIADEQPSALTEILIGLLQFALVLLAPFTEGLTLIPAAAISVGQAYKAFKDYERAEELHNTDFGAAALSAEEPSLFWLGVAIVAAGLDVGAAGGAALKLFRQIAPAARAIKAGETGEVAAKNLANVERAAADAGGEALAKQVGAEAKAVQQSAKGAGVTAEEAAAFERVGAEAATEELKNGAQSAANIAGGETKVSMAGDLWSCRSPCVMVRERYAALLEREPKYATRVQDLETRARALADKTGAEADAARKTIANEAATLEREMRTTAQAGDWTSPLKDSPDYNKLLERRGSALPELDSHPPNWTGWDEAKFRYGSAANEIPEGYTFALQENGELAVRRLPGNESLPPMRFNAATGAFEAVEESVVRAEANAATRQSKAFGELSNKARGEMKELLAQREKLILERERLEKLAEKGPLAQDDAAKLSKTYGQINDKSRLIGEAAADELYKNAERVYPKTPKGSTAGDFDRVYKVGDEYHVVEAKGGGSGLGTRNVAGEVVEQGTGKYLDDIIANMRKNPATSKLANELELARSQGKLKYVLVRAPIDTEAGAAALKRVTSVEFKLE